MPNIIRTLTIAAVAALACAAGARAADPGPRYDHGLRIFNALDEGFEFTFDGKDLGHFDFDKNATLGVPLGNHKLRVVADSGADASADLTLDDSDVTLWHGNKFWCLTVRPDNNHDIEFNLASAQSCQSMLADIDASRDGK